MACKCARSTDEYHGWCCTITDGACVFLVPNSKKCAELYGEGPDVDHDHCEDCADFYTEDGKRCCKREPLSYNEELKDIIKSKFIDKETISCGAFTKKKD